jgi:hypothetical protein
MRACPCSVLYCGQRHGLPKSGAGRLAERAELPNTGRCTPLEWLRAVTTPESQLQQDTCFEKHYTVLELSKIWRLNRETVRQIVQFEPGVVRVRRGLKKMRTHYSVPESVVRRIHNKLDDLAA